MWRLDAEQYGGQKERGIKKDENRIQEEGWETNAQSCKLDFKQERKAKATYQIKKERTMYLGSKWFHMVLI